MSYGIIFKDRVDAGRQLAAALCRYQKDSTVLLMGIPRGGVVVTAAAAKILELPFDVFMVRKLGVPGQEELAMGAVSEGGCCVRNPEIFNSVGVTEAQWEKVAGHERRELERRIKRYRGNQGAAAVKNKRVIVMDDGLATGATMEAAVLALKERGASRVIVAVPVAPADTVNRLRLIADEVIALLIPETFHSVGEWYQEFSQTEDEEVIRLLGKQRGSSKFP